MSNSIGSARSYFKESDIKEIERYSEAFLEDINNTDIDEQTKKKYYDIMIAYKENKMAANIFGRQFNALNNAYNGLAALYNEEIDEIKKSEYKQKMAAIQSQQVQLKEKYDYFSNKCDAMQEEMMRIDKEINSKLPKLNDNREDNKKMQNPINR
jgi:hypothetical protein